MSLSLAFGMVKRQSMVARTAFRSASQAPTSLATIAWLGNMADPAYRVQRREAVNCVYAGGKGAGLLRVFSVVKSGEWSEAYQREAFISALREGAPGGTQAAGLDWLERKKTQREIQFSVLQLLGCYYGKHYFLGDLVSVEYAGAEMVEKVKRVEWSSGKAGELEIRVMCGVVEARVKGLEGVEVS